MSVNVPPMSTPTRKCPGMGARLPQVAGAGADRALWRACQLRFFLTRARRRTEERTKRPAADPRPPVRRSGTMGGARPPRPAVAGLTESDLVTLYSVGALRAIAEAPTL